MRQQRDGRDAAGPMDVGKDHLELLLLENCRVENRLVRHRQIGVVRRAAQHDDPRQVFGQERAQFLQRYGVHLVNDPLVVRRDDLGAILKIGFEAVVMRRIVARRDNDAAMRLQPAHGETELGRRPRRLKDEGNAAQARPAGGRQLAEVAREMPHIVSDDELRGVVADSPREVAVHVTIKADRGPHHREVIHHVAAHRRMFGGAERTQLARFASRGDDNRPPAHPAGAKLKELIEAVVQLAPCVSGNELVDAGRGPRRESGAEPGRKILQSAWQQLAGGAGSTDLFQGSHGIKSTRMSRNVQNG